MKNLLTGPIVLSLLLAGCGEPIHPQQVIEKNRLLGAKVEVEGDPGRAWPMPGERATVRFLVADPAEPAVVSYGFEACAPAPFTRGVASCAREPFSLITGEASALDVRFDAAVPDAYPEERLLLIGALCANGSLELGDGGARCLGPGSELTLTTFDVHIGSAARTNTNPDLADDLFEIQGQPWLPPASHLPLEGCRAAAAAAAVPVIRAGVGPASIRFVLVGDDREWAEDGREYLELSSFSTAGKLTRLWSYIESDDERERPVIELDWELPELAPEAGRLTRFYFVARDGRGGADFAQRAACLVP